MAEGLRADIRPTARDSRVNAPADTDQEEAGDHPAYPFKAAAGGLAKMAPLRGRARPMD